MSAATYLAGMYAALSSFQIGSSTLLRTSACQWVLACHPRGVVVLLLPSACGSSTDTLDIAH
ncbi:hypothetical protein ColLi_09124 [Colletotrichum liriopes]|uniref:Uncharacterized protein n=1 Tax=Colletotrichum liriopes TaxID=708192 RepID=A0AA37GTV0_9PEZI|nr:hypothetical protein ColLi_09124 [Colletotrichum liriopes]